MESIREIYRVGHGPSSSHTIMKETGADMDTDYKETSRSGLAKYWQDSEDKRRGLLPK